MYIPIEQLLGIFPNSIFLINNSTKDISCSDPHLTGLFGEWRFPSAVWLIDGLHATQTLAVLGQRCQVRLVLVHVIQQTLLETKNGRG